MYADEGDDSASDDADRADGGGKITLTVVKAFGASPVEIWQITAQPIGVASGNGTTFGLKQPFSCTQGATLDLSAHWHAMVGSAVIKGRVLPASPPNGDLHGL